MIQIQHIGKIYKTGKNEHEALKDVNLSFRDNEFVAILGPSGSGKTTLLNIIGGLDRYTSGDLIIDGISTKKYKDRDWDSYRNHSIGFIFQSYNLIQHQTVLSNVELALTISGVSRKERRARAVEALTKVGLEDQIHKKPNQLSGGQMQRVAIARALINNPQILLADEPTGALDSKTSIQVMDLLREVAKDRLVIMVTHNPELAEQYANRIVNLKDGEIISDTAPFVPETAEEAVHKNMGRSSMRFWTALSLSFHNLRTKKGRTILTAFAGSIGIIGIALILSLSTGVDVYTGNMEKEMLAEYPIQVMNVAMNLESLMQRNTDAATATKEEDRIYVYGMLERLFSMTEDNDLQTLKHYIDTHTEELEPAVKFIEYTYAVVPQIYKTYVDGSFRRVNPDSTMEAAGLGSSSTFASLLPSLMSSDVFFALPSDRSQYENQFSVLAGRFPENYDECVVVLSKSGGVSDFALYDMGLRDPEELDRIVQAFLQGGTAEIESPSESFEYDDFLGLSFRLVNNVDFYEYDAQYDVWKDRSSDEVFMKDLIDRGEELKIVGILRPTESNTTSQSGVGYPFSLIEHVIEVAEKSEILKAQLADPETDVFTNTRFGEQKEAPSLDMASLVDMDAEAAKNAIKVDFTQVAKEFADALDLSALSMDQLSINIQDYIDVAALSSSVGVLPRPDYSKLIEELRPEEGIFEEALGPVLEAYEKFAEEERKKAEDGSGSDTEPSEEESDTESTEAGFPDLSSEAEELSSRAEEAIAEADIARRFLESEEGRAAIETFSRTLMEKSNNDDVIREFLEDYIENDLQEPRDRFTNELKRQISAAEEAVRSKVVAIFKDAIQKAIVQVGERMMGMVNIDTDAFLKAFRLKMTAKELGQLISSLSSLKGATFENNLKKLGYASLDDPSSVSIYPIDFAGKEVVLNFLNRYNEEMEALGKTEAKISYTDTIGTIMSSVTLIITIVSSVLMATVGVSLVVSSIMIGIITYISVLERKKEIGILRAIGASKRNVAAVFNAETLITGFLAGLIGIIITYLLLLPGNLILHAATGINDVNAILRPEHAVILIAISMFLTFIGGLIPARSASKCDPVVALRTE